MQTQQVKTTDEIVQEYIESQGIIYSAVLVGPTKKDDWECDAWVVKFKHEKGEIQTDYFTGVGHRVDTPATKLARIALKGCNRNSIAWVNKVVKGLKPKTPSAASVLYSLLLDSEAINQSFDDWASNFGYDTDSRKAFQTYEACCEIGKKVRKFFKAEQVKQLQDLLQDY